MLSLGRTRLTGEHPWVVAGDLEQLPFPAGTFDKAYCLSAIHHIPDIPSALAELHRVLTPDGAVFFSEPGEGHAGQAGSVTAMRDFGVLEQDIVASDFMAACTRAGFAHVTLRPMSYLLPGFELTLPQWKAWTGRAESTRPFRAAHTIWRGVLQLLGRGKHGVLIEETLAMHLVRLLRSAMGHHPVIVAAKRVPTEAPAEALAEARRAEIQILAAPPRAVAGSHVSVRLRLRNIGSATWQTSMTGSAPAVRLGVQLLGADERLIDRDFYRYELAGPVAAGQSLDVDVPCPVPETRGPYAFKFDLVEEGVTWFEPQGSASVRHAVEVT
jgi:hypothetical protein